jgi:hypothetical protein
VTANACSGCGATFPPIALAKPKDEQVAMETTAGVAAPDMDKPEGRRRNSLPPVVAQDAPKEETTRAWPLILVAVAAGGIPLLWMNRDRMPLPKAWQIASPQAKEASVTKPSQDIAAPAPAKPLRGAQEADKSVAGQSATARARGSANSSEQAERKSSAAKQGVAAEKGAPQRDGVRIQDDRPE